MIVKLCINLFIAFILVIIGINLLIFFTRRQRPFVQFIILLICIRLIVAAFKSFYYSNWSLHIIFLCDYYFPLLEFIGSSSYVNAYLVIAFDLLLRFGLFFIIDQISWAFYYVEDFFLGIFNWMFNPTNYPWWLIRIIHVLLFMIGIMIYVFADVIFEGPVYYFWSVSEGFSDDMNILWNFIKYVDYRLTYYFCYGCGYLFNVFNELMWYVFEYLVLHPELKQDYIIINYIYERLDNYFSWAIPASLKLREWLILVNLKGFVI